MIINPGDVVALKSQRYNPKKVVMTVDRVVGQNVSVAWFDGRVLYFADLGMSALVPLPLENTKQGKLL